MQQHNKGLDLIMYRLMNDGNFIAVQRNIEYHNRTTHEDGEIDIMAVHKTGAIYLFEYKTNPKGGKEGKAKRQMDKAVEWIKQYMTNKHDIVEFYVCGTPPQYKLERRVRW